MNFAKSIIVIVLIIILITRNSLRSHIFLKCSSYKLKTEILETSSIIINNSKTYNKTITIHNKKARECKIVSTSNYSVKNNTSVSNNSKNENYYKNIDDWLEYINSENTEKQKKNNKKKNILKKTMKKKDKNSFSKLKNKNNIINNKLDADENDYEIEEFRRNIKIQSIKANLIQKIKPQFTEKWLKLLNITLNTD